MKQILLLGAAVLLVSCSPNPLPSPNQPITEEPPLYEPTMRPIDEGEPTAIPDAPTPDDTPRLVLGSPFYLGRGRIDEAALLPGAQQVVVAFSGGVSLITIVGMSEVWWHPTDLPIVSLTTHPDGSQLALLLRDRSVEIIEMATGETINRYATLEDGQALWGAIAWSPDGSRIAFQSLGPNRNDPIYLLEPETGTFEAIPDSAPSNSWAPVLIWSPDGKLISARKQDACIGFIDSTTGEVVVPPRVIPGSTAEQGPGGCYDPIAWTPDGQYLLTHHPEGVGLVDPYSDVLVRTYLEAEFPTTFDGPPLAAFSDDGTLLAGGGVIDSYWGTRTALRIWNAVDHVLISSLAWENTPDTMEERERSRIAMRFDGETLVSVHQNGMISKWDFRLGRDGYQEVGRIHLSTPTYPIVWSHDGNLIATASQWHGVSVWSLATRQELANFGTSYASPAFSPDREHIALINTTTGTLEVVNLDTGESVLLPDATGIRSPWYTQAGEYDWGGTAYSPDGRWLTYRSYNRVIIVEPQSGVRAGVLEGHDADHDIRQILWSPDSGSLLTVAGPGDESEGGEIILWHVEGDQFSEIYRTVTARYEYSLWAITHALFNPSGTRVAINESRGDSAGDFTTQVVDTQTGEVLQSLKDHWVFVGWIDDDQVITLRNDSGWINRYVTNVRTGTDDQMRVNFVGDEASWGHYYAHTGGSTTSIGIGDWLMGTYLTRADYPGINSSALAWSPDGRWLLTYMPDEVMFMVWPVTWLE